MVSRRRLLKLGGLLWTLTASWRLMGTERTGAPRIPVRSDIPRLIFFPECRVSPPTLAYCAQKPVSVVALQASPDRGHVSVHFSNGQVRLIDARLSFADVASRPSEREQFRLGVRVKSLASWLIDSVAREVRGKSKTDKDFLRLQEQDVLDAVTLSEVTALIEQIRSRTAINEVRWDAERAQFLVR